jgi:phage tail-like protein
MAESIADQRSRYPLPAYNFKVTVNGETMSFSEVSGLTVEYETTVYRHGLSYWEGEEIRKQVYQKFTPVTFKRGIVRGWSQLHDWLKEKDVTRAVKVSLCDEEGVPAVTWSIARAIAIKLEAPAFEAATGVAAVETLEVMAAGISLEHHPAPST